MKTSGIDFPARLLSDLRDGNLVIFAGAGVSMGDPSRLYDFNQLALRVAEGTGTIPADGEPEDRFLGRLEQQNVNVHARVAQVLRVNSCGDTPQPNSLHTDLLRLFGQTAPVRLVTTNFDLLFRDGSQQLSTSPPELFRAPALPLGDEFDGIVHIHGAIDHPSSMVLTDADFGRAYLTQGWARRFLLQLFRSSSVLFVGYRHQDTVMNYLSRALPPDDRWRRFALVRSDKPATEHWTRLRIQPIFFPKSPGDGYIHLYDGIHAFAGYATLGVLGWQHRIGTLAAQPPPLGEKDADLIDEALRDPARTRFFTRVATDPSWLQWLDQRGHLDVLFESAELPEHKLELAEWVSKSFSRKCPHELFLLTARHHTRLHPSFWYKLARCIGSKDGTPLSDDDLARWTSLLLTTATVPLDELELFRLTKRCAERGLFHHVVAIFDAMIAPRLVLMQHSSWTPEIDRHPSPRTDVLLDVATASRHFFERLWREAIVPRLEPLASPLLSRVTARLRDRHRTHLDWKKTDRTYDFDSSRRYAIEQHEKDEFRQPADPIVDAARDCLEHLASSDSGIVARWCEDFATSTVPLLRRLTAHALSVRQDLSPDAKCAWLLGRMDIHDPASHHEMFRVIRQIYPELSDADRSTLIEAIRVYRYPGDEHAQLRTAARHFDWFEWLNRDAPDCPFLARELEAIKAQFPQLQPSEHPDLTHYVSQVVRIDDKTPWTVERILSRPADQWVHDFLTFAPTDPLGPSRNGLLLSIEEAATREYSWGITLSDALVDKTQWESDLWAALLRAWSKSELTNEQRLEVLTRLNEPELRQAHIYPIADFLCESHKPSRDLRLDESLDTANELALDMWDRLAHTVYDTERFKDWLTQAINHPAGNLAQFWIFSLWMTRNSQDPVPTSLTGHYLTALSRIAGDATIIGTLGRTVLCRGFAFLLEADDTWTTDHLLPLFHVEAGQPDSTAAWCGYLYGNNTSIIAIEAMKPMLFAAAGGLHTGFNDEILTERFIEAYTFTLFFYIEDPLPQWIPRLLQNTEEDKLHLFATYVLYNLRQIDGPQRLACWDRWLKRYWKARLQGVPRPLSAEEIDTMLTWIPLLEIKFSQAIDIAIQMPQMNLTTGFVLDEIVEANFHDTHPEPVAKLMGYLRHCRISPTAWQEAAPAIHQLLESDIPDPLKTSLREILAELGID